MSKKSENSFKTYEIYITKIIYREIVSSFKNCFFWKKTKFYLPCITTILKKSQKVLASVENVFRVRPMFYIFSQSINPWTSDPYKSFHIGLGHGSGPLLAAVFCRRHNGNGCYTPLELLHKVASGGRPCPWLNQLYTRLYSRDRDQHELTSSA